MQIKWWQVVLVVFYVVDLAVLHYFTFRPKSLPKVANTVTNNYTDVCGPDCQKHIDVKIKNLPTSKPNTVISTSVPKKSKIRRISYLPISTGGQTLHNDWVILPATSFYFDVLDYPGLVEIYFETNLHLFNGNGTAFVRLFDETHGVGVQGSEVSTNHQKDTAVVSGKVSFYQGKNLISVQAKSLTADTTVFTSGRLKIVTEN